MKIVEMMRDAGATEVHFRVASPPTAHSCFYGVDTPERSKLLAARMDIEPMRVGAKYAIKHTTRSARALVKEIKYELDVNTLHRHQSPSDLALNAIGRVTLRTTQPLMVDPYQRNRQAGSFILIDEATNRTVGAGTITEH